MARWIDPKGSVPFILAEHRPLPMPPEPKPGEPAAEGHAAKVAALQQANERRAASRVLWTLRPLSVRDYAAVQDLVNVTTEAGATSRLGTYYLGLLRRGLSGVEGKDAPTFTTGKDGCPTDDFLVRIPSAWRSEVAQAIDDLCAFGEVDTKA